jgi:glycine/D-amino acid oxidase-like deaminating enzyme
MPRRPAPRKRRLRTGTTPWAQGPKVDARSRATLTAGKADVVVIGAGISGACVAHSLTALGREVVVLDRDGPARGSTMASAALITFELDLPLHRLARRLGTRAAVHAWRQSIAAVDRLRQVVHRERLASGWEERESLYLAGDAYGHRALRAEASMRAASRIPGRFMTARRLRDEYGLDRTGALHATGVAVADPVRLTGALFNASTKLELISPVEVSTAVADRTGVILETTQGNLRANAAVFCTGYSLLPCLPQVGLSVDSTWAIASPPATGYPDWLDRTIVWEASDPYLYMRTTADGRLVAGGSDEESATKHGDPAVLSRKARRIASDAAQLLGTSPIPIEHCWSGAFGSSASGLPVIGPVPGLPGCFVVAGFGGNGITHAMLAGELLAAELSGHRLPHAQVYHPGSTDRSAAAVPG